MAAFNESDLEKHLGGGEEEEASSKVDFVARFGMSFQKRGDFKKAVQESKAKAKAKPKKKSIYVGDRESESESSNSDAEPDYGEDAEDQEPVANC